MTLSRNAWLPGLSVSFNGMVAAASLAALAGTDIAAAATHGELHQRLIEQGWQASPDDAGNTLLHPPTDTGPAAPDPVPDIAQATTPGAPDLYELLRQRGWVIHESAAGPTLQLLIDPPPATAAPAADQDTPQPPDTRSQDLYRMLEQRGWRVHRDATGNTLLIPTGKATPQAEDTAPATAATAADAMTDFRRAAESTGWHVESGADGSLTLHPPGPAVAETDATDAAPDDSGCPGAVTASVADGSTGLPIADEAAARRLAEEWLAEHHPVGRSVGRLRRINRIYVVSIVEATPPFPLRNQLIIRRDDGGIVQIH